MFEFGDTDTDREITDAFNALPTVERAPWFPNLEAAVRALAEVVVNYDLATAMDGLMDGETQSAWANILADQSLLQSAVSDILYAYTRAEDGHADD